ncbi:GTPase Era [Flavobacteriaceae bacterium]|jgi:GTP-binding protein Era|nr:GTPase Era [Flavobacteriaceae bacterium]MDG1723813.1 GTPase Era [Flavobacteriaceae bacterium]MDG2290784.1 GTPase Era [Flavobacteriaceae bacterium]
MHKAGFVNIIGSPNVGKSTLINAILGEKLVITNAKAQTTRHRILGMLNAKDYQLILSDTPGIIQPAYKLQESMMDAMQSVFDDADVLIYMVEIGEKKGKVESVIQRLAKTDKPLFLVINKIDKGNQTLLEDTIDAWKEQLPNAQIRSISALEKFQIEELVAQMVALLPEHQPYFPKDQLTDKSERFVVNEVIRDKILSNYDKEIPYSVEVATESFKVEESIIKISAVIFVERNSQKGILIGHKGAALKKVGTQARRDLERFFEKKVHLELFVKVNKDWRSNANALKRFGY